MSSAVHKRREYRKMWSREAAKKEAAQGRMGKPAWAALLTAARQRGLEVTIKYEDIVVPTHCPVLGIPLDRRDYNHSPSVDRIDNSKGYTKDNIVVVSRRVNRLKSNATIAELIQIAEFYRVLCRT